MHNYTSTMMTSNTPNVNSISYGWQGNLSELSCQMADVYACDNNFVKLAGMGVSIMISSGDSGSGYTPAQCDPNNPGKAGVNITAGTLIQQIDTEAYDCCEYAQQVSRK